ncbi:MAG: tRNA (adenosine(37)-N6)-threonylcarbamoyltransferase complex dimerization subunit type 1 TsaB [Thermodesulfovibrionales bacterium]
MKILAIETSTLIGGVCIFDGDKLIADGRLGIRAIHSERLMTHIDFLLNSANLSIYDIDYFAVAIGPGSFTGLRVGIATVKGLAFATNRLIAPVSTLEALALNVACTDRQICPILDARKGELYAGVYKNTDGALSTIIQEIVLPPTELIRLIKEKTIFLGDGVKMYGDMLKDALGDMVEFIHDIHMYPSATNVAFLAKQKVIHGELISAQDLTPQYIRKSEAEIRFG